MSNGNLNGVVTPPPFSPQVPQLGPALAGQNILIPQQYGAVGDGVTDDTNAVQACVNYAVANNYAVYLGGLTYAIKNLTLPTNNSYATNPAPYYKYACRIYGEPGCGFIKINGGDNNYLVAAANWVTNTAYVTSPIFISNVRFDGNGIANYAYVGLGFGSKYIDCVFTGALLYGCYEPCYTENGTTLLNNPRSNSYYVRCLFFNNGTYGFVVDPSTSPAYITDYHFLDNFLYDNGPGNLLLNQVSGWFIKGNHTYWSAKTPTSGNWSAFIGSGVCALISGNVWEGYGAGWYGLEISGGGGPIEIIGDSFETGLGLNVSSGTSQSVIRIANCTFSGSANITNSANTAGVEVISQNNSFAGTVPYVTVPSSGFVGVFRSFNDRVSNDNFIYEGNQSNGFYSVKVVDGVIYPPSFPYQIVPSTPSIIRTTTVLTANEVINLPNNPKQGLRYRVIRGSTATGAFSLQVKTFGGTDVADIATAGNYIDYVYDGVNWFVAGSGAAN
jgi:hypothetical protein